MIPDADTVAQRRHLVTVVLRTAIVLFGAWVAWGMLAWIVEMVRMVLFGPIDSFPTTLWGFVQAHIPAALFLALVLWAHSRIAKWIVPAPRPGTSCPACGYSLKGLKSPICPECGTSLSMPR